MAAIEFQSIFTIAEEADTQQSRPSLSLLPAVLIDAIADMRFKWDYVVLSCPAWLLSCARMFPRLTNAVP